MRSENNLMRLPWLDMAKGVAMVAVVFSHEFASIKPLVLFTNSFMLPLFFIASGYCLSPGKYGIIQYVRKKFKVLLLPYIFLGILVSAIQIPINGVDITMHNIATDLFSWQTLWFLPILFVADIIVYISMAIRLDKYILIVIMIFSLVISLILDVYDILFPLSMSTIFIAVFYIATGFYMKQFTNFKDQNNKYQLGMMLFMLGILLLFIFGGNLNLKKNMVSPIYIKVLFSLLESVGLLAIFYSLSKETANGLKKVLNNPLCYIGRNTMVIFAFHMPIFFYCQKILRPLFDNQILYKSLEFILMWGICLVFIPIFNNIFPLLIGKQGK